MRGVLCLTLAASLVVLPGCLRRTIVATGAAATSLASTAGGAAVAAGGAAAGAIGAVAAAPAPSHPVARMDSSPSGDSGFQDPAEQQQRLRQQAAVSDLGQGVNICSEALGTGPALAQRLVSQGWTLAGANMASPTGALTGAAAATANAGRAAITDAALTNTAASGAGNGLGPRKFLRGSVQATVVPRQSCTFRSGAIASAAASGALVQAARNKFDSAVSLGSPHGRSGPCDGYTLKLGPDRELWVYFTAANGDVCTRDPNGTGVTVTLL